MIYAMLLFFKFIDSFIHYLCADLHNRYFIQATTKLWNVLLSKIVELSELKNSSLIENSSSDVNPQTTHLQQQHLNFRQKNKSQDHQKQKQTNKHMPSQLSQYHHLSRHNPESHLRLQLLRIQQLRLQIPLIVVLTTQRNLTKPKYH